MKYLVVIEELGYREWFSNYRSALIASYKKLKKFNVSLFEFPYAEIYYCGKKIEMLRLDS